MRQQLARLVGAMDPIRRSILGADELESLALLIEAVMKNSSFPSICRKKIHKDKRELSKALPSTFRRLHADSCCMETCCGG